MMNYVKNEKGYEHAIEADWAAIKSGLKKVHSAAGVPRKVPTSVALDPAFLADIKKEASIRGVPFQVLMRIFIMEGFQKLVSSPKGSALTSF